MATYCLKPSDVYTRKPEIPAGWVYDGFRFAEVGEYYLYEDKVWARRPVSVQQAQNKHICPQIIVKKAGPPLEASQRHTCSVSVSDIYGEPFPPIPDGWVRADFRFPYVGENYLPSSIDLGGKRAPQSYAAYVFLRSWGPRIILEPAPPQAPEDWWE